MEVTGMTEKGRATVARAIEKFNLGMNIEEIAESEGMDEAALRILIYIATEFEES